MNLFLRILMVFALLLSVNAFADDKPSQTKRSADKETKGSGNANATQSCNRK